MAPPLTKIAAAVAAASSEPVIESAAQLGALSPIWPILATGSSLVEGKALGFIESIYNKIPYVAPNPAEKAELAQYLALSTACHVLDGWRYISQAALAFLVGSRTQALHLAYYAELRAALSILASSGIGILNQACPN